MKRTNSDESDLRALLFFLGTRALNQKGLDLDTQGHLLVALAQQES